MSRDKQIEEMASIIHHSDKNYNNIFPSSLNECLYKHGGVRTNAGIALYNAGYRKASEVAEEIFGEIEKIEKRLLNRQKKCDKEAQKAGWYLEVREAYEGQSEGIGLCLDYLAELKKKCESEGEG